MDVLSEKDTIYKLMQEIMVERRQLTKQYFDLKEKLDTINQSNNHVMENRYHLKKSQEQIRKENIEIDKYFLSIRDKKTSLPYTKIAFQISHILKNSGIPLSNKQIYKKLIDESQLAINYSNLSNNILPRINLDSSINVEKVTRGFWQYKLNN